MSRTARSLVPPALVPLGAAAALAACSPSAPTTPTWQADVKPILAAACVRCHGVPAIGGAPTSFRLDTYEDTYTPTGNIRGAGTMARFIRDRVCTPVAGDPEGCDGSTMPPRFPLEEWQVRTLVNWEELRPFDDLFNVRYDRPPQGDARPGNAAPTATATITPGAGDRATVAYELRDPDRELVYGEIRIGPDPSLVAGRAELHAGRGTVDVDVADLATGDHMVWVVADDGSGPVSLPIGSVAGPAGNASPQALFVFPSEEAVVTPADPLPFTVDVLVRDRDGLNGQTVDLRAVSLTDAAAAPIALGSGTVDTANNRVTAVWTVDAVADGRYAIEAVVSDGTATRTVRSPPVRVAHGTTTETFDSIKQIFDGSCLLCHSGPTASNVRIPGVEFDLRSYDFVGTSLGAYQMRAKIYRRVIIEANMPPTSTEIDDADRALTTDERARIASWILAGAPQ